MRSVSLLPTAKSNQTSTERFSTPYMPVSICCQALSANIMGYREPISIGTICRHRIGETRMVDFGYLSFLRVHTVS